MPRSLLDQILQLRSFQCPSCNDWQQLGLDEATLQHLRGQQRVSNTLNQQNSVGRADLGHSSAAESSKQSSYGSLGAALLPDPRQLLSRHESYNLDGHEALFKAVRDEISIGFT